MSKEYNYNHHGRLASRFYIFSRMAGEKVHYYWKFINQQRYWSITVVDMTSIKYQNVFNVRTSNNGLKLYSYIYCAIIHNLELSFNKCFNYYTNLT